VSGEIALANANKANPRRHAAHSQAANNRQEFFADETMLLCRQFARIRPATNHPQFTTP
jgi:hypothetical protein